MTVQEICSKLKTYYEEQYNAGLKSNTFFIQDIFPDSLEPSFTQDLLQELQSRVASGTTTVGEAVGIQEAFAFIGSLQREDTFRKSGRMQRMLGIYTHKRNLGDDEGPVTQQLNHIGVKTGSEFLDNLGSGS